MPRMDTPLWTATLVGTVAVGVVHLRQRVGLRPGLVDAVTATAVVALVVLTVSTLRAVL